MSVNSILQEIKSNNITGTNILIKASVIFVGRKVWQIELPKRKCCYKTLGEKNNATLNKRTTENINVWEGKKRGEIK